MQGVGFTYSAKRRRLAKAEASALEQQTAMVAHEKTWSEGPLVPIAAQKLVLQPHEQCFLQSNATITTLITESQRRGGFGGLSIPVGRTGIRLRTGQFASHNVSTTHVGLVNQGELYLTNLRIVCISDTKTTQLPLNELVTLDVFADWRETHPCEQ